MSERLRLSVVVPHLNQPEALARCLKSLIEGRRPPDEIIVVDNGSDDLPVLVCAAFSNVQLLQELTPGPGPARNLGARMANGDVIAFTDADCVAASGWLAEVERVFLDASIEVAGGDVRVAVSDPDRLNMIEAYESVFGYQVARYIRDMHFTVTCNLAVRPTVLAAVGPFAGLSISEDRDWGQRATAVGYQIHYVPQMVIFHPARSDFKQLRKKWDRHMGHDFAEAVETRGGRTRFLIKAVAMAPSVLAELPRVFLSDRISGLRSRCLAFAGLARIRAYRAGKMAWLLAGGDPSRLSGAWNRR